ncbi:MAG: LD-carboxypeptidase [Herpetosiphonaceae bacterium]|nr:LD-carboxypeptidase [Herpetosiphonaceae bacterium]
MEYIKPAKLNAGDTVAILSPSWGGPSRFPVIYEQGLDVLRSVFGLRTKEYPTARADAGDLYTHPQVRAADINAAFADPEVRAIIPSIGGDDSVRILPFLDPVTIIANPKILLGFSDTTTLLAYCNQLGLVTFQGPSIMAGFAQAHALPPAFIEHVRAILFDAPQTYQYHPYTSWSEGYPDWGASEHIGQTNPQQANSEGWRWLQGSGRARGRLFGGNIEVLEFLKGTRYWPAPEFWHGKLLFFETSEEEPTPSQVKYMLRNYGMQGIYEQIAGILFGRARGYSLSHKRLLEEIIVTVVAQEFGRPDLPLVANLDFGHTDPQWIMPLGVEAEVDCTQQSFRLLEPACGAL